MSERSPSPADRTILEGVKDQPFVEVIPVTYSNGAEHLYGVDVNGKKHPLGADALLNAYDIDPATHWNDLKNAKEAPVVTTDPVKPATDFKINKTWTEDDWSKRADSHIDQKKAEEAVKQAREKEQHANGKGAFTAAREREAAEKVLADITTGKDKLDLKGKVENLKWNRKVKLASDYLELMDKLQADPNYDLSAADQKLIDAYDAEEQMRIRHGMKPLLKNYALLNASHDEREKLERDGFDVEVSDDDIRYYRSTKDAPEKPADVADTKVIEPKEKMIRNQEYARLLGLIDDESDRYARVSAGSRRRFGLRRRNGFSAEDVDDARIGWLNAVRNLSAFEAQTAHDAGVDVETLMTYAPLFGIENVRAQALLTQRLQEEQQLATGNFRRNGNDIDEIQPRGLIQSRVRDFYRWWGRRSGERFFSRATLEKSVAMLGPNVALGFAGAAVLSPVIGPIAGGALGGAAMIKLAKGLWSYRLNGRAGDVDPGRLDRLTHELSVPIAAHINSGTEMSNTHFADLVDDQTGRQVGANRRRFGMSIGAAIVGGVAGDALHHVFSGSGGNHTPNITKHHHALKHHGEVKDNGVVQFSLDKAGQDPWEVIRAHLEADGYPHSDAAVLKITQAAINNPDNHLNWVNAHDLHVGYKFGVPYEAFEHLKDEE